MKEPASQNLEGGEVPVDPPFGVMDRRALLLAGLGILAGCSAGGKGGSLPAALWPTTGDLAVGGTTVPAPMPTPGRISGTLARSSWATGDPIPSRLNPMLPPQKITIHHDGMPPFSGTDVNSVSSRIDLIRRAHLNRDGGRRWGDIGYHFVVDRAGKAWEARPLRYQGAHVKDQNEGNIGILCLGNYEEQIPTDAQMRRLEYLVVSLRKQYSISSRQVHTHRELCNNCTLCPGRHLQQAIVRSRDARRFG